MRSRQLPRGTSADWPRPSSGGEESFETDRPPAASVVGMVSRYPSCCQRSWHLARKRCGNGTTERVVPPCVPYAPACVAVRPDIHERSVVLISAALSSESAMARGAGGRRGTAGPHRRKRCGGVFRAG